jgi:hypothetical protein
MLTALYSAFENVVLLNNSVQQSQNKKIDNLREFLVEHLKEKSQQNYLQHLVINT